MSNFYNKLREIRKSKKVSQLELANIMITKQQTISKWEKNMLEPSYDDLLKLCNLFNVTSDYLLGIENEDGTKINNSIVNSFNGNNNTNNINIKG